MVTGGGEAGRYSEGPRSRGSSKGTKAPNYNFEDRNEAASIPTLTATILNTGPKTSTHRRTPHSLFDSGMGALGNDAFEAAKPL